ncbi:hypothetical protein DH2020_008289 [Rehmannia glutinosa]|uniref:Phytosulfokine n=1 Tax=Rehmannia glutinosa TaxID=99300 RepID=A0ABR0U1N4_REHGL
MESKFINLFVIVTLLFSLAHASRPDPSTSLKDAELKGLEVEEAGCKGVEKEECLMRRTLAAHVDYIYTGGISPSSVPNP